jgi:histidinol-phosphate/aromatic aminotransferase/cobyric acid decarboxylase-like protein
VSTFRAELAAIPLSDNSVDVVTTNHAIEPNGGREVEILFELLRIAKRKIVLFEPCYEIATDEGKARMRQHGYVRDLRGHLEELGAKVESLTPLKTVHNPLNPTACIVVACE